MANWTLKTYMMDFMSMVEKKEREADCKIKNYAVRKKDEDEAVGNYTIAGQCIADSFVDLFMHHRIVITFTFENDSTFDLAYSEE